MLVIQTTIANNCPSTLMGAHLGLELLPRLHPHVIPPPASPPPSPLPGGEIRALLLPGSRCCRPTPLMARPAVPGRRRSSTPTVRPTRWAYRFIASRFVVASSSPWPPERKTMPGTDAGTVLFRHCTVFSDTSSRPARPTADAPESTIFGFSRIPSNATPWDRNWRNTSANAASVAS